MHCCDTMAYKTINEPTMKKIIISFVTILTLHVIGPVGAQEEDADTGAGANAETLEVQEIKYVTDKLRLSLYKGPNDRSGTLQLLVSGDELKILEKSGPYARVIVEDGSIGWVKNGFLVSEPTASQQLVEEQKKNEILASQIEKYSDVKAVIEDYENTIELIKQDQTALTSERDSLQSQLDELSEDHEKVQSELDQLRAGGVSIEDLLLLLASYWYFIAGLGLILLAGGFLVGKYLVEIQVRKRFQGVKVW